MSNEDRIKLYSLITDKYEVAADEIEKEFGINVGRQLNVIPGLGSEPKAAHPVSATRPGHHVGRGVFPALRRPRGAKVGNFLRGAE